MNSDHSNTRTNNQDPDALRLFIHIDADAFFASVEQCVHHELYHKPVVTGRNGSIVVAVSYEAKKLGVTRGLPVHEILRNHPQVHVVASDYAIYQIFSDRMLAITKQYLNKVSRDSIDEMHTEVCISKHDIDEFLFHLKKLQQTLSQKLGIGLSFGIGSTRTIAKIASAMEKPRGFTYIPDSKHHNTFLELAIEKVPGFGRQTSPRLRKLGIATIRQFLNLYPSIASNFNSAMSESYDELSGIPRTKTHRKQGQSINRARSFKANSNPRALQGQLTDNLEYLVHKLRANKTLAQNIYLTLRDTTNQGITKHCSLPNACDDFFELQEYALKLFKDIYQTGRSYRYVSVTLGRLVEKQARQLNLFEQKDSSYPSFNKFNYQQDIDEISEEQSVHEKIWQTVDMINHRSGYTAIHSADGMTKPQELGSHLSQEHPMLIKRHPLLPGEQAWRRLAYPFLGKIGKNRQGS